jgi:hypothetical protein
MAVSSKPLGIVLAVALAACDGAAWLRVAGVRTLEEVDAPEAVARVAEGAGVLLQVREPDAQQATGPSDPRSWRERRRPLDRGAARDAGDLPVLAGASLLGVDEPLPEALIAERRSVLVVASDPEPAWRVAARLARSGVPRVAVVRGGIQGYLGAVPAEAPSAARRAGSVPDET